MKKVLVLLLVLGMASAASAALQISLNGDPEPVDSELWLLEGETALLDIWTDADLQMFAGGSWQLVVGTDVGSIVPGAVLEYGGYGTPPQTVDAAAVISPAGMEGIWGIYSAFAGADAGTVLYDQILFTCEGEGDAIIQLWDAPDGAAPTTMHDQIIIHQIPEPATICLLGLGGLALLRRRK